MDKGGRKGGMNWEIGIHIHILPFLKHGASGKLLHSPGSSARSSVMTQRGGVVRGAAVRRRLGGRGYMYVYS